MNYPLTGSFAPTFCLENDHFHRNHFTGGFGQKVVDGGRVNRYSEHYA